MPRWSTRTNPDLVAWRLPLNPPEKRTRPRSYNNKFYARPYYRVSIRHAQGPGAVTAEDKRVDVRLYFQGSKTYSECTSHGRDQVTSPVIV